MFIKQMKKWISYFVYLIGVRIGRMCVFIGQYLDDRGEQEASDNMWYIAWCVLWFTIRLIRKIKSPHMVVYIWHKLNNSDRSRRFAYALFFAGTIDASWSAVW